MMGTDFPKPKSPLPPPSPALVISFLVLQPTLGYFPLSKPPSLVKLPRCVLALSFFWVKSYNLSSLLCPSPCHPLRLLVHCASLLTHFVKGLISTCCCSQGWSLSSGVHDDHLYPSRLPSALRLQRIGDVWTLLDMYIEFPLQQSLLACYLSRFCCLRSLQPTLPAHLLCHSTVNEHTWHRPWFTARASPPTHTPAAAFWHVETRFTQRQSCEPILI